MIRLHDPANRTTALMVRGLLILPLLVAVGCGTSLTGDSQRIAETAPDTADVGPRKLQVVLGRTELRSMSTNTEFTGSLLPARGTSIATEIDGIVESTADIGPVINATVGDKHYDVKLGMQVGQEVQEGQILAQLEREPFELEVEMAKAGLAKAQADLAQLLAWERQESIDRLIAAVDEAQARKKLADAEYQRALTLARQSAASQGEVERAAMEVAAAEAMVVSQQATLKEAQAGPTAEAIAVSKALVAQAEVILRQKERLLEKTSIRAPYDGAVTTINVYKGAHVSPAGAPLFELLDLRFLAAEVGIPEAYLGKIKFQDLASVAIAGVADPVPGMVVAINDKVDPESRQYRIRVAIDNEERRFKAGQFVTVTMRVASISETTIVPTAAIKFEEGQPGVYVYDDGQVHRTPVSLGMSSDKHTEIIDGLQAGVLVVVDDPSLLNDGMRVAVRNTEILKGGN